MHARRVRRKPRIHRTQPTVRIAGVAATALAVVAATGIGAPAYGATTMPNAGPASTAEVSHIAAQTGALDTSPLRASNVTATVAGMPTRRGAHRAHHRHRRAHHTHTGYPYWYGAATTEQARTAVRLAFTQLGKPYTWGGAGPAGFDCSGLTQWVWRGAGVRIPRTSEQQARFGTSIRPADVRPGDLVVYYPSRSHVAIYIGASRVIVAPHQGAHVHISTMRLAPINTIRRP